MFGFLFLLVYCIADEMKIRKSIRDDREESEKRCAEIRRRGEVWREFEKKYR